MTLRFRPRTSRDVPWVNLHTLDLVWGVLAPALALWLRDPGFFAADRLPDALVYVAISSVVTGCVFIWFRVSHSVSRFFSLRDAMTVIKASAIAVAIATLICFLFTRLENIPRGVPLIHFMVLAAGDVAARASRYLRRRRRDRVRFGEAAADNVLIVGVSDLSWFYVQIIEEFGADLYHVIALIDDSRSLQGRFVHGYPVAGRVEDIEQVLDEYAVHGITIDRLILAADPADLPASSAERLARAAQGRGIPVDILPERLGLAKQAEPRVAAPSAANEPALDGWYWRSKRWFDFCFAALALVAAAPLAAVIALLVLVDCGVPVVFWQVRIGRRRQRLTVYKFRTLKAPYDRRGVLMPDAKRLSWIGRLLRLTHLDELPQLVSVVLGDMSLIGPRPLLPADVAKGSRLRFAVRPGITGWAQINGATLVSPEEKNALDEWYVRHASWRLDLAIAAGTVRAFVSGVRRNEAAIAAALAAAGTLRSGRSEAR